MSSTFYLPRILSVNDKSYTEAELLAVSNYVVVLAEPGGGNGVFQESCRLKFKFMPPFFPQDPVLVFLD